MTFKSRLTIVSAAAVAVAVVLLSVGVFAIVRSVLRGEVDKALSDRSGLVQLQSTPQGEAVTIPAPELGGAAGYVQLVSTRGGMGPLPGAAETLPVDRHARAVAAGRQSDYFRDAHVSGVHVRILTKYVAPGFAVQVARPLTEVDSTLRRLEYLMAALAVGGVVVAGALGRAVAGAALAPVRRLSEATKRIASTRDLTQRIDDSGRDELAELAGNFNTMLGELEKSVAAQRGLVADASHELRTPLTSLRTNVELLQRGAELAPDVRARVLQNAVSQLEELTTLVADVVELARGNEPAEVFEDVQLDILVEDAVERGKLHAPGVRFETTLRPSVVRGVPERLDRAVANLIDNACKWSPQGGVVEVAVRDGDVTVRDHGPGIADEDLPRIFDRFYRASSARQLPGSGLGLAIVRQVAETHGGTVTVEQPPGGGARFHLRLPPLNGFSATS
jgi:two-component system sensor histidine kinase MprB